MRFYNPAYETKKKVMFVGHSNSGASGADELFL